MWSWSFHTNANSLAARVLLGENAKDVIKIGLVD